MNTHIPKEDVTHERNGLTFQVASKGVPMSIEDAQALGLVEGGEVKHVGVVESTVGNSKNPKDSPSQNSKAQKIVDQEVAKVQNAGGTTPMEVLENESAGKSAAGTDAPNTQPKGAATETKKTAPSDNK